MSTYMTYIELMKRRAETDKPQFVNRVAEILGKLFRKLGELLVKLIKRIIKEVW